MSLFSLSFYTKTRIPDMWRASCQFRERGTGPHTGVDVHFRKDHVNAVVVSLEKQTLDARTYKGTLPFVR
jgi:hypothetical protein